MPSDSDNHRPHGHWSARSATGRRAATRPVAAAPGEVQNLALADPCEDPENAQLQHEVRTLGQNALLERSALLGQPHRPRRRRPLKAAGTLVVLGLVAWAAVHWPQPPAATVALPIQPLVQVAVIRSCPQPAGAGSVRATILPGAASTPLQAQASVNSLAVKAAKALPSGTVLVVGVASAGTSGQSSLALWGAHRE